MISNLVSRIREDVSRALSPTSPLTALSRLSGPKGGGDASSPPLRGPLSKGRLGPPYGPHSVKETPSESHIGADQGLDVPPKAIVLAVSGGPDSLCLADAVLAISLRLGITPIIAHLDHGLRDIAARDDAEFVRTFAQARGVPCIVGHADVAAHAQSHKLSIEVAARDVRYAFLARTAEVHSAQIVALAHHADDQAETVLLRLLRGTGLHGLRGMQMHSPLPDASHLTAVRPLLHISRADIERYCAECNLQPRHDATNADLRHTRNRVRHELLPMLEEYNPNIRGVLTRLADTVTSDLEIIEHATRETFERLAHVTDREGVAVDRRAWRGLPAGLQRAVLRESVLRLRGDTTNLGYAAGEEAREVLNSDAGMGEIALMSDVSVLVHWKEFVLKGIESESAI